MILATIAAAANTITITIPLNIFTWFSFILLFIYFLCGIGMKHASHTVTFIVIVLAIVIFCIGYDPNILHFLLKH